MPDIQLRPVADADLDAIFDFARDPVAVRMAAFTADDPDDRAEFDAHWRRIRTDPRIRDRAIVVDGELAGTVASFPVGADTEITYWLGRSFWGRGIATAAVSLFLETLPARPVLARAASDNIGSLRVLHKAGFRKIGTEIAYANQRGEEIEETLLRLPA
ncbi:GNAT family N-acetyltransferase [Symbioplanes lichenis]|uniref:GNAT family N-acetyltransferase n=1 Tax=Symbioplanes lichenis TaxID=1629072 RepID=UPI00273A51C5|nr:GNAT family N-acetyltransferase [Actinoplanes lichenis]